MGKRTTAKSQPKKKRWVTIKAAGIYAGNQVGETYISNAEDKVGQKMTVSQAAVTGENSRQNLQLKFVISKVHEGALVANFIGAHMLQTTLKKLVRKNKDKIDLSFIVRNKDKEAIRVKVLATTRNKTTGGVITKLVKRIIFKVNKTASEMSFDEFAKSILSRSLQKDIQGYLKKTYPVALAEVRSFELLAPGEFKNEELEVVVQSEEVLEEPVDDDATEDDEDDSEESYEQDTDEADDDANQQ